jgi:hypothetical protein
MARLRPVAVVLHVQAVVDDGTWLDPIEVPPVTVTARQWPPDLDELVTAWQAMVDELSPDGEGA